VKYADIRNNKVWNIIEADAAYANKMKRIPRGRSSPMMDLRKVTKAKDYLIGDTVLASGAIKARPAPPARTRPGLSAAKKNALARLKSLGNSDPATQDLLILLGHG